MSAVINNSSMWSMNNDPVFNGKNNAVEFNFKFVTFSKVR